MARASRCRHREMENELKNFKHRGTEVTELGR